MEDVNYSLDESSNYIGRSNFEIEYNESEYIDSFQQAHEEIMNKRAWKILGEDFRDGYQQNDDDYSLSELEDISYQDEVPEDLNLIHTYPKGCKLDEINPGMDDVDDLTKCTSGSQSPQCTLNPQSESNLSSLKKTRPKNPLLNFIDNPNSSMKKSKKSETKLNSRKCPKKEYYRIKLIRSWKKNLRKMIILEEREEIIFPVYNHFYSHYFHNKVKLIPIADTHTGPLTEAQKKKIVKNYSIEAKSFNNKFVKEMFMNQIYLQSFRLYVISEFMDKDCEELIKRFDFMCCKKNKHGKECKDLWMQLKEYSLNDLLFCNNAGRRDEESFN